eukprot:38039-Rhodomonas_salina.2
MYPCWTCKMSKSKMCALPRRTPNSAPYPNYRWFSDLTGKMRVLAWSGAQYAGIVMDDSAGLKKGVTVKLKSDFPAEYDLIKRQLSVLPKYFQTDGGS